MPLVGIELDSYHYEYNITLVKYLDVLKEVWHIEMPKAAPKSPFVIFKDVNKSLNKNWFVFFGHTIDVWLIKF